MNFVWKLRAFSPRSPRATRRGERIRLSADDKPVFHLLLIVFLGLLAYSNTFNAPFQWDEEFYISENPLVRDLSSFTRLDEAEKFGEYYSAVKNRYIGYLTFALNYKFGGLDVRGYHIVNIAIHILNAMLVYFLAALTFRTPFFTPPSPPWQGGARGGLIALFAALLFVSHPIQTEAVTYIFQRLASLMAFFYLLSLVLYIKWRLTPSPTPLPRGEGDNGHTVSSPLPLRERAGVRGILFYFLSLTSAVLAMKTKENAFTLPVMIALYEFFFFSGTIKKRTLYLVPFLLTMLSIPLSLIGTDKPIGEMIGDAASLGSGYPGMSRWDYLFTQFRVIVTYIRLLFLPINQNIDYDYPIFNSFFNPQVLLSFLFLLSLLSLAVYLFYRSKNNPKLRLVSFGIFWFFIALSVESGIIPIPMVINEYRVYLPSVGAFTALTALVFLLMDRVKDQKKLKAAILLTALSLPFMLAYAAHARNAVWGSRVSLWEDATRKSPEEARAHYNLGVSYMGEGLTEKAVGRFLTAIKLKPDDPQAHYNIGVAYRGMGLVDKAVGHLQAAIVLKPDYEKAHFNLGLIYLEKKLFPEAQKEFEAVLHINPYDSQARKFLDYVSVRDKSGPH